MKKIILNIGVLLLISCGCQANNSNLYVEVYDEVILLIETNYFDDISERNNFISLASEYRVKVKECQNEDEFIYIVNSFLFTFNVSHIGFGKTSDLQEKVAPYLWYEYSAGIDIRIINGEVCVTAVNDFHPNNTQIKMGDRISKINSKSTNEILSEIVFRPPNNQRNYNFLMTEETLRNIYGTKNENINVKIINEQVEESSLSLSREQRKNGHNIFEGLPKLFLDIKSEIYYESIGYIKFNAFQPRNPIGIISQINEYKKLPNLIIDIRGNNGGSVEAITRIASELLKKTEVFYKLNNQNNTSRFDFSFSSDPYKGNLIILVDELSISAAEIFSDILQITGSAKVVGLQTPGNVLSGEIFLLSDTYSLLLPIADWIRSDGFRLEGNGVKPDYTVELKVSDLTKSIDTQLDFALNLLK